jgi:hypothetical protein
MAGSSQLLTGARPVSPRSPPYGGLWPDVGDFERAILLQEVKNTRYTILAKAANDCPLWELTWGEALLQGEDRIELARASDVDALRQPLQELVKADMVRVYDEGGDDRALPPEEAVHVLEQDAFWVAPGLRLETDSRTAYALVTTPAGDAELELEWKRLGKPLRMVSERTVRFLELAGRPPDVPS